MENKETGFNQCFLMPGHNCHDKKITKALCCIQWMCSCGVANGQFVKRFKVASEEARLHCRQNYLTQSSSFGSVTVLSFTVYVCRPVYHFNSNFSILLSIFFLFIDAFPFLVSICLSLPLLIFLSLPFVFLSALQSIYLCPSF